WNIQHKERQRLAMAVEAEAGIDAPFEDVVEYEIECRKLRQIVAHDMRRLAGGENLSHPLRRHLRRYRVIVSSIAADDDEVEPGTLLAAGRAGIFLKTNGARHVGFPNMAPGGSATRLSMRHDALATRGLMRRGTPAPPAGPAQ